MKKIHIKSLVLGLVIGIVGITTVFSTSEIKSATFSDSKVYFYGNEIPLKNSLVLIEKEGNSDAQLYMPMKELLEYMQFNVQWNSSDSSVNLTMNAYNGYDNSNNANIPLDIETTDADKKALDIIQRTGNWGYIEPYLPYMSSDGIKKSVEIYNSKHMNPSEHKKASDYINA
ncbi:hypothetical protein SAMN05446037_101476 [Anaerovirgula multivorans]|uniref:Copper amine oxidase N-terminal domain-containing protein n=1 Tax=Anaerovirgula multivorans TaxID=312168 RepID=A0A239FWN3_9FIRM|nr:hypothetical protein [Anaerovirgula multivorans]SNS61301.1 hypothetical protein SAMN05446037_101476 [Anaerovirgula multivorans]